MHLAMMMSGDCSIKSFQLVNLPTKSANAVPFVAIKTTIDKNLFIIYFLTSRHFREVVTVLRLLPRIDKRYFVRAEREGGENDIGEIQWGKGNRKSGARARNFVFRMFVEDEHPVGRQVVIAGKGVAGEEIVHRFVKLDADG